MLQVRQQEQPDIVRHGDRVAFGVRHDERSALLVKFKLAVGLDDLRAVARGKTARKKAVAFSGHAVGNDGIGERKIRAGIEHVGVLVRRAAGLAEAIIGEGFLAAGNMRHQPFKDGAAGLIGIEAEIEIVVQVAAALRQAKSDRAVDAAGERDWRCRTRRRLRCEGRRRRRAWLQSRGPSPWGPWRYR